MGATRIFTVDTLAERLEVSRSLGADVVIDFRQTDPVQAILEQTGGRGVDVAIAALGTQSTFESALRVLHTDETAHALEVEVRDERWLLLDNPERRRLVAGGLDTDALYVMASANTSTGLYAHVADATRFEGFGLRLSSQTPSTTERGAFDASRGSAAASAAHSR